MGVVDERTRRRCICAVKWLPAFFSLLVIALLLIFGVSTAGLALQKPTLGLAETASSEQAHQDEQPAAQEKAPVHEKERLPAGPLQPPAEAGLPKAHAPEAAPPVAPEHGAAARGEAHEAHGEDHVELPEISSIPGVTFVDTLIKLMDYELNGRMLGWRPNGIMICRLTDSINNYQLGVLEAVRFTTLRLKDSLTRLGEADTYDPDLEQAVNELMINASSWWFPSAESSYSQAIEHLKKFKTKLEKGQRSFYYRRDTLVALLSTYKDQIGNVNRTLVMPVGWRKSDAHFYYAKGVAHVYYEILKVCRVGFKNQLATMHAADIMDEVLHELLIAEKIDPWIVLDSGFSGFFANHRANLNAPLSEAAHLLAVLSVL
ncbi:MAG TPA: DUF2333 family protein [Deltaproteobacteria bacterium]|nr:DUF2333 family protein [Deltaproteobacteria bacterium]